MNELPSPLTPPDCDLRTYEWMPLDVNRLLTSETWILGTSDEKVAALTLWCESWRQVPAASLPDDDRMLAHLSRAGSAWKKVCEAVMRSWVKCADGRLYHPVVAEKARFAWEEKQAQRARTEAARLAKLAKKNAHITSETLPQVTVTSSVTEPVIQSVTEPVIQSVTEPVTGSNRTEQNRTELKERKDTSLRSVGGDRACRLPADWQPSDDDRAYAERLGLNADCIAEDFRGYWHAKAKDATKAGLKGWALTWQGWCRREAKRRPPAARRTAGHPPKPKTDWAAHDAELAADIRELINRPADDFAGVTIEGSIN